LLWSTAFTAVFHTRATLCSRRNTALPATPAVEQTILFGMFTAAAGFWMAVTWWIVR